MVALFLGSFRFSYFCFIELQKWGTGRGSERKSTVPLHPTPPCACTCTCARTHHTCALYRSFQDSTLLSMASIRWLQLPDTGLHPISPNHSGFPDRVLPSYHRESTRALKNTKIQVAWMCWSSPGPVGGGTSTDRSGSSWNCLWTALLPSPNTPKASSPMLSSPTAEGVPRVIFNLLLGQGGPELHVMQKFPMHWGTHIEWLGKNLS